MKLKVASQTHTFSKMGLASLLKLVLILAFASCVPTAPNGDDIEIETAESSDPEIVNAPATGLRWGDDSVESGTSYANKARAFWNPSNDAPFFSRQKVHFYSDANCTVPMGGWRNVPAGKNEFWVEGLTHLGVASYQVKTYTDISEKDSPCSTPITVDLVTQKAPVITSNCGTVINQGDNYRCEIQAKDLNLQTLTYSLNADTCGAGNFNIDSSTGVLTWNSDDDDFTTNSCSVNLVVTDTDTDTDTQALSLTLNNAAPTLSIASQSVLENSGAAILLTDAEVQASDEGFGQYTITADTCDPALGTLSAINATTGEVSFTPAANLHGTCTITIQFDDQNFENNTVVQVVNVTIVSTNQAPTIAENCASSKTELETYACQITSTDGDVGDTLTYSLSADNTCAWAAVDGPSGAVTTIGAVPLTDLMVGLCTLGLQVSDGNDTTKTQKAVTINNATPTLSIADVTDENNTPNFSAKEILSDAQVNSSEEPTGTYSLVTPDNEPYCSDDAVSITIDPTDGHIDFHAENTFLAGSCFIKVQYTDTHAATVTDQFLLNWNQSNSTAQITEETTNSSCTPTGTQSEAYTCEIRVNPQSNVDRDQVEWEVGPSNTCNWVTSADFNTSVVNASPNDFEQLVIADTPTDDDVGTCTIGIRVKDLEADGTTVKSTSTEFTRSVTIANVVPTFNAIQTEFSIAEDAPETTLFTDEQMQVSDEGYGTYSFLAPDSGINCLDPDPGTPGNESGNWFFDTATGEVRITPATNFSDDCSFKVHFDDGNPGGTVETTISIDFIEEPDTPVISESCVRTMTEDDGTLTNTYSCTIGLDDPDFQDTHTWYMADTNNNPSCSRWLSFADPNVNVISGVPEDDNVGICDVRIYTIDSTGNTSNELTWTVTINNQVPTITPVPTDVGGGGEFLEDTGTLTIKADDDIESLDEGYGVYSLDLATVTGEGCHEYGILEIDPLTGAVRFLPAANWSGTCNVKLSFDDENPSGNTDAAQFQVTITEVQDNPNLNINHCPRTLLEDGSYFCEPRITDSDTGDTVSLNVVTNSCATLFRKDDGGGEYIEQIGAGPNDDDIGACTLVLEAEDNNGNKSAQETLTISILNQPPVININVDLENIYVKEDATDTNEIAANDGAIVLQDADVQSIDEGYGSYSLASAFRSPSCMDIFGNENINIDATTGQLTAVPPADYSGYCFVKIQFNDGNNPNGVTARDIKIKVLAVSDVPTITQDCDTEATQGATYTCDFNFSDVELNENHIFELAADNTCSWMAINAVTGVAHGTPSNQDINAGTCDLSVNIRDGRQVTPTKDKFTITLNNVGPAFTIPLTDAQILEDSDLTIIKRHQIVSTTEEGQGGSYSLIASATSPDCQSHTATLTVNAQNGEVAMEPTDDFNGDCYVNIQFDDGNGSGNSIITSEFKVSVNSLADIIAITSDCPDTIAENSVYNCTATLSDPDNATGVTWSFASGHTCNWLTIGNVNGIMSATPTDDNVGTCVLSYQATDGIRTSEIKQETITITNVVPTFVAGGPFAVNENTANALVADINVNDNQEGFGIYSIKTTTATAPNCRDEAIVSIDPITGQITYTPGNPANVDGNGKPIVTIGSCYLTILFDDGNAAISEQEYEFDIQEDNDPPTIVEGSCNTNITEDSLYTCSFTLNDEEVAMISIDGGSPTHQFNLHSTHNCSLHAAPGDFAMSTGAQVANSSTITYQFTPTNVQSNLDNCKVAFTVEEISSGVESALYTKTLNVQNNKPTFTLPAGGVTRTEQDGAYSVVTDAEIETDDEAEENAAITAGVLADHIGRYSLLTVGSNRCGDDVVGIDSIDPKTGAITFDPDEGAGEFNGTCNFYVSYDDGTGVQSTSLVKQIAFTVTPVVDAPTISGDTCDDTANENSEYSCDFSVEDPDGGETLTWSFTPVTHTCNWMSIDPITGSISGKLTDAAIDTLNDSCVLSVRVNDGTSNVDSTAETITLVNRNPDISTPTDIHVKANSTNAEIITDFEISTAEELGGHTGGYSLVSSEIEGSAGQACDNTSAINIQGGPDSDTGAITVTTNGNTSAKCRAVVRYTDRNGGTSEKTILIWNDSDDELLTITTACADTAPSTDQGIDYSHCDLTTLVVQAEPALALNPYDETNVVIDPASTCPRIEDGAVDGVVRDGTTFDARFANKDVGTCTLVYYLALDEGNTKREVITFTTTNVAPTFTGDNSAPINVAEDGGVQEIISDANMQHDEEIDDDENLHAYAITNAAGDDCRNYGDVAINNRNGRVTFSPINDYNGTCDIEVTFYDGNGASAGPLVLNVTVDPQPDGPDIAGGLTNNQSCLTSLQEGSPYSCLILHNDPDTGNAITWTKLGNHDCGAWLTLSEDGSQNQLLQGTPTNNDVGTCTVHLNVADGTGNSDQTQFDLTIANASPEIEITAIQTITEDGNSGNPQLLVDGDDIDVSEGLETDGAYALDDSKAQDPKCGEHGTLTIDAATGEIMYTPQKDYDDVCNVYVTFDDGNSAEPSGRNFFVQIVPVDDVPTISTSCEREIEEGDDFVCYLRGVNPEEEQELSWSLQDDCGWLNLHNSGVLYGKPDQSNIGTCEAEIEISDQSLSSTKTLNILVRNKNPVLNLVNKEVVYSSALTTYVSGREVYAREEGEPGTSYNIAPNRSGGNSCFNIANTININADGSIEMQIDPDKRPTYCNVGVEFNDGTKTAYDLLRLDFLDNDDNLPTVVSDCVVNIQEGSDFVCYPKANVPSFDVVTWSLHGANTCDWISINSESGFLQGVPENDDVGTCTLAFYAGTSSGKSSMVYYDINVTNLSPSFDLPNSGTKSLRGASNGVELFSDSDIEAIGEGSGFYFFKPSLGNSDDCRLDSRIILDNLNGSIVMIPNQFFTGTCTLDIGFFDLNTASSTYIKQATVTIGGQNSPPTMEAACSANGAVGEDYLCNLTAQDIEGDDITFDFVNSSDSDSCANWMVLTNGTGENAGTATLTGQPTNAHIGTCQLEIFAKDSTNATYQSSHYKIEVTVPNIAGNFGATVTSISIDEDAPYVSIFTDADVAHTKEGVANSRNLTGKYFLARPGSVTSSGDCRKQGKFLLNAETGEIKFSPFANYDGNCKFNLGFDDLEANDNIQYQILNVEISGTDDTPTITSTCPSTIEQDQSYGCFFQHDDIDTSGGGLWEETERDTCSWMSITESGTLAGTPDNNDVGSCFLSVKVTTDGLESLPYEQNITVTDFVSSFALADKIINEDSSSTIIYNSGEVQAEEEGLGFYYISDSLINNQVPCSEYGTLNLNANSGEVRFAPNKDQSGVCHIRIGFQENNAPASRVETQAQLTILPQNDVPELHYYCSALVIEQNQEFSCRPEFFDLDGDTPTSFDTVSSSCSWLTLNSADGTLIGNPGNNDVSTCSIRVISSDGTVPSNEVTLNLEVVNMPPELDIRDTHINKNAGFLILRSDQDVQATEEGFGNYNIISTASTPSCASNGSLSIDNSNGQITFSPTLNFVGICFVNISFDDGNGGIATSEFQVTVNDLNEKPTVSESCSHTATEGVAYSCSVTMSDDNHPGASLSWHMEVDHVNTCDFLTISAGGIISGTPDNRHVGTCQAAFYASDGVFSSNVKTVNITVNNATPTLTITNKTINENNDSPGTAVTFDANASGEHPTKGIYSLNTTSQAPDCRQKGRASIGIRDGVIEFTPETNFQGECYFKVRFDDENDGAVEEQFKVTVTNTPDAPVITTNCTSLVMEQDETRTCNVYVTEIDDEAINTITVAGCPWVQTDPATGVITLTPDDDDVGTCTLSLTATDANGDPSNTLTDIDITVTNKQPGIPSVTGVVLENNGPVVALTANQIQSNEEGFGVYSIVPITINALDCDDVATLNIDSTSGEVTFNPDAVNWTGECVTKVQFDDQNGASNSVIGTHMSIKIGNINDAPTIDFSNCNTSINEGTLYSCTPSDVTDSDLEYSNDSLTFSEGVNHTCDWMTISRETGLIHGTPQDNKVGICKLHIVVADSQNQTDEEQFDITVNNVDPTFNIEHAIIPENTSINVLVRRDIDVESRNEGFGSYTIQPSSSPARDCQNIGPVTVTTGNGEVRMDPDTPITADCDIRVRFTDTNSAFSESEFTVFVETVDNPPSLTVGCDQFVTQDNAYNCSAQPTATDDGGSSVIFLTGANHTCYWMNIDTLSGQITGTPGNAHIGECTLELFAYDGIFFSNPYTRTVEVRNQLPVITLSETSLFLTEDFPRVNRPLSDTDVECTEEGAGTYSIDENTSGSPSCTEVAIGGASGVTIEPNGAVTFDAPEHYEGTCYIKIVFDDGNESNNIDEAEVQLIVLGENDDPALDLSSCDNNPSQDDNYSCAVGTSEPDIGDKLSYSLSDSNTCSWAEISPNGGHITANLTDEDVGTCTLGIKVQDVDGITNDEEDTESLIVTVANAAPTLSIDDIFLNAGSSSVTLYSDEQVQSNEEGMGIYALDNGSVTGTKCSDNSTGLTINAKDGTITMDIDNDFTGTCNIIVTFNDGNGSIVSEGASVTVTNDANQLIPQIIKNETATINQGNVSVDLSNFLVVKDFDTADANVVFTVTSIPKYGELKLNAGVLNQNDTFTLGDLVGNDVTYNHLDNYSSADSIEFSVTDGNTTFSGQTFNIVINDVRGAGFVSNGLIFANNGQNYDDLSTQNKNFSEAGYSGDRITVNDSSGTMVSGSYISFPTTDSNFNLKVQNLYTDANGFSSDGFAIHFYMKSEATVESMVMATNNYNFFSNNGWGIKVLADGTLEFNANGSGDSVQFISTNVVNDNKWHAITISRIGSNLNMYIDGLSQGAAINVSTVTIEAEQDLIIGAEHDETWTINLPNALKAIDEIKIYKSTVPTRLTANHFNFTCPENFVMVPGSINSVHLNPFCAAKYEMKEANITTAISKPDGVPWFDVTQSDAKTFCSNMGSGYSLINNNQWMSMADHISTVNANWNNGVFSTLATATQLPRGNFESLQILEADADDANYCANVPGCSQISSWNEKMRTLTLPNGEVIWDLAGNAAEHVDKTVASDKPGATSVIDADFDVNEPDATTSLTNQEFKPNLSASLTNEDHAIGSYVPGTNGSGGIMLRGGSSAEIDSSPAAGLYFLDISNAASQEAGFRCIFLVE
jgi:hypothetical protein